jgi:hypothetical protein
MDARRFDYLRTDPACRPTPRFDRPPAEAAAFGRGTELLEFIMEVVVYESHF